MSTPTFAETHNLVAFLEKPTKSKGYEQIVDFLNANSIKLTVNPTLYSLCIEQFWTSAKVKTVKEDVRIQALVDGKKVIVNEASIRRGLRLDDVNGTSCLPNDSIFEELARMRYEKPSQKLTFYKAFFSPQGKFLIHTILQCLSAKTTAWNEFSSTMASAIIFLANIQKFNFSKYIFENMMKNLDGGVKFLMYPRFVQVFVNQQLGDMTHHKRIFVSPSHIKKIFANMKREGKGFSGAITPLFDTMMVQATEDLGKGSELPTDTHPTPIITQPSSSKTQKKHKSRRTQRKEIEVPQDESPNEENVPTPSNDPLPSEEAKTAQAKEIVSLKKRVKKLERKQRSRTSRLKRLKKVGAASRVESSKDKDSLVTTTGEVVTTANVRVTTVSAPTTTIDEMTLAQTLIEIKAAKPKAITTAATTVTAAVTRPKEKGVVIQDSNETTTTKPLISSKDKRKGIMAEDPLLMKKKDQIKFDEEVAKELEAKLKAEMEEEYRADKLKEEEANIALIESWEKYSSYDGRKL
ncbi:hypothetical protein Tco_0865493 [Tanacetum coccineum]